MGMIGCFAAVSPTTLAELRNNPDDIENYLYPNDGDDEPPNSLDVDKAWHGIHFLLAAASDDGEGPLTMAVLGGEAVGDDMGYGPARFLEADKVKAVSDALQSLGEEAFQRRYAPQAMEQAQIYPDIWVRDGDEALDYILDNYRRMVVFYSDAAQRGDAALLWLS